MGLTPGVEIKNLAANIYGTAPTASALPALLSALARLNSEGVLASLLDLERVILGGHSAGGRVAIPVPRGFANESANPSFSPKL